MNETTTYSGSAFWSYGFRPFFLSAAIFVGVAIPAWIWLLAGAEGVPMHYRLREWHMHEMVFGFLSCVITGFLLTALPNWTERPPMSGKPLLLLWLLWLGGRVSILVSGIPPLILVLIDGIFLVVVAAVVWREIVVGQAWDRVPLGVLISLYAFANLIFHGFWMSGAAVDVAVRLGLSIFMVLLALIGGKITPGFTEDYFEAKGIAKQPAPFSPFDGFSILLLGVTGVAWMIAPESREVGAAFVGVGVLHLVRMSRWYGWLAWRKPLVVILHVGYGWLALSFLVIGGAMLGVGIHQEDAIHALTTGAVGVMTLAVMTRASLGHTGRPKHAGLLTIMMYLLVNLGAILRVFGPSLDLSSTHSLVFAAGCWSGAYLLFVIGYGPMLLSPSLEEE